MTLCARSMRISRHRDRHTTTKQAAANRARTPGIDGKVAIYTRASAVQEIEGGAASRIRGDIVSNPA